MYGKIILNNVKRNIKDYGVYFLTLMISVAVFYSFNSIETQPVIQEAIYSNTSMVGNLIPMIHIISKFVAVMLAVLILYANQFLLKRRKKELGIYMILGMSERRMSAIFVGEIILIGMFALCTGLGVGCILSQVISVFAIKMFTFDLSEYRFVFSQTSLKETIICFAIIFAIVIIFNIRTIMKVKLIDMLTAARKNEQIANGGTGVYLLFLSGAFVLYGIAGYLLYFKEGLSFQTNQPAMCFLAICVATALLIYSMAGLCLQWLKKKKSWYLKGINIFLVRQISSKMQSNFITMTAVSLLLTGTICIVSLGMGIADAMNDTASKAAPYDVMIFKSEEGLQDTKADYYQELLDKGLPLEGVFQNRYIIEARETDVITYKDILADVNSLSITDREGGLLDSSVTVLGISDYNAALGLQGKAPVSLPEGTYLLNSNYRGTDKNIQKKYEQQESIIVKGNVLKPANTEVLHNTYYLSIVGANDQGTIIVSDAIANELELSAMILVGNYVEQYDETQLIEKMIPLIGETVESPITYYTKTLVHGMYYGTFSVLAFICCYIGVILLIICVAVLSLQQLTEANDNVRRYQMLQKLGVEEKVQRMAILKQISVYFGVPLIISVLYAIVALPKVVEKIRDSLGMEVGLQVIAVMVILFVIYGSYFVFTYISCRSIVAEKTREE
ncbi:MAG: ABC transporter permease [Lachnospiraceae bacterium]|nr:ABC transporter permease [Lachnospiraceae bacterium]